ncbi:hypothetical protein [Agromyces ramosus]|uniref:Uncharacterized protein n=1 Tax=Agromyces ramosus TaxID=33879 RepID=A0ABU0R8V4_9MICO|nr:hypothetical protein [Agromyces ramosus]MDQ0894499.1 hypothetical protein [Agromyces ramosus]
MVQTTIRPTTDAASVTETNRAEAAAFFLRMRRMVALGQFKRVAREAMLEPRLLMAMREMLVWSKPRQQTRNEREARERDARAAAHAHFLAHRRDYIDPQTRPQMPPVRIGAEHRTEQRIARNNENALAWARRVAAAPEKVLARHASHTPYNRWAVLRPEYGPVRNPDEFWEARVNRDVRAVRRRAEHRNSIRPAGMTLDRALAIARDVLDAHSGKFPKPDLLPDFL